MSDTEILDLLQEAIDDEKRFADSIGANKDHNSYASGHSNGFIEGVERAIEIINGDNL